MVQQSVNSIYVELILNKFIDFRLNHSVIERIMPTVGIVSILIPGSACK